MTTFYLTTIAPWWRHHDGERVRAPHAPLRRKGHTGKPCPRPVLAEEWHRQLPSTCDTYATDKAKAYPGPCNCRLIESCAADLETESSKRPKIDSGRARALAGNPSQAAESEVGPARLDPAQQKMKGALRGERDESRRRVRKKRKPRSYWGHAKPERISSSLSRGRNSLTSSTFFHLLLPSTSFYLPSTSILARKSDKSAKRWFFS